MAGHRGGELVRAGQRGVEIVDPGREGAAGHFDQQPDLIDRRLHAGTKIADCHGAQDGFGLAGFIFELDQRFALQDMLARGRAEADLPFVRGQALAQPLEVHSLDIAFARGGQGEAPFARERCCRHDRDGNARRFGTKMRDRAIDEHRTPQIVDCHAQHGDVDQFEREQHRQREMRQFGKACLGIDPRQHHDREDEAEGQPGNRDTGKHLVEPAIDQPYAQIGCGQRQHDQCDRPVERQQRRVHPDNSNGEVLRRIAGDEQGDSALEQPFPGKGAVRPQDRRTQQRGSEHGDQGQRPVIGHQPVDHILRDAAKRALGGQMPFLLIADAPILKDRDSNAPARNACLTARPSRSRG